MSAALLLLTRLFDLLFAPFGRSPLAALAAASLLTALLVLIVYRLIADQKRLRRAKNEIKAHLLALRLFQDQMGVFFTAQARLLRSTGKYFLLSLPPLAVVLLPVVAVMVQLDLRLSRRPFAPREVFLVTAVFADPALVPQATLHLPSGLALDAPPVHIPSEGEITWRLRAVTPGQWELAVDIPNAPAGTGHRATKHVVVGSGLLALASLRARGGWWQNFLHPAEPPLPSGSPLQAITLAYPDRPPWRPGLGALAGHWLVPFLFFTLVAAFALKGLVGTEF